MLSQSSCKNHSMRASVALLVCSLGAGLTLFMGVPLRVLAQPRGAAPAGQRAGRADRPPAQSCAEYQGATGSQAAEKNAIGVPVMGPSGVADLIRRQVLDTNSLKDPGIEECYKFAGNFTVRSALE